MINPPRICVPIINESQIINPVESLADIFEVRIDLIGKNWRNVIQQLKKPWLACNRRVEEGGTWNGSEKERIKELMSAMDAGARYIDIELATPAVETIVKEVKGRADVIISYHNFVETPPVDRLRQIIINQLAAGADICKVVTTAQRMKDNVEVLELMAFFPDIKIICFAMGALGRISRIMCPLSGGYMTWASTGEGNESADGQIAAEYLRRIYRTIKND